MPATPAPISMLHVATADYLAGYYGTTQITPLQAAPFLTWAQTDHYSASAISAAGIKTQLYVDPNRVSSTSPMYGYMTESDYAHDCSGDRITFNNTTGRYVTDPNSSSLQLHFAQYVARQMSLAHFDMIFEDNAGPLGPDQQYASFTPSLPCNYTDASWIVGGIALDQAPLIPIIVNGIEITVGYAVSETLQLYQGSNTVGGNFENCYSTSNKLKQTGGFWATTEDSELQTLGDGKIFECMLRNQGQAASNTDARLYGYASYLLTYNPARSIFWEEFQTPSGFHVEPESELVALDPVLQAPSDVTSLKTGTGVYARQYAECFLHGQFVGACIAAVNPDPTYSHAFPSSGYTRTLALSGGGVLDGGTVSVNGPAPQTLGPGEAAIAFK
jgi:hypothetical protein